MAHTSCMLDKQGYIHARACTRPRARANVRKHARTYTQICDTYCFYTETVIRGRASVLRYTYTVLLFIIPIGLVFAKLGQGFQWFLSVPEQSMCFKPTSTLHTACFLCNTPQIHFLISVKKKKKTALPTVSKSLHNADIQLQILTSKDSDLNQNQRLPSATYRNSPLPLALPSFLINILPCLHPLYHEWPQTGEPSEKQIPTNTAPPPPPPTNIVRLTAPFHPLLILFVTSGFNRKYVNIFCLRLKQKHNYTGIILLTYSAGSEKHLVFVMLTVNSSDN
jgi:hypothetical protein